MPSDPTPISLATPNLAGNELAYVQECIETGWVSSVGRFVDRFEREFASAVGAEHAVATVNGTAALHVALLLAGVEPDDEVIVPALTFIAPANAVRYCGAWPVFTDVEPEQLQLDPEAVDRFLRDTCIRRAHGMVNQRTGRRVRAILAVDLLGHPADTAAFAAIAEDFGLELVEDATESLGASRRGRPVGAGARLACFSFNGNKLLTTGGGGMLVTDDAALAWRAKYLTTQAKDDPTEYVHGAVGFNYRLTNLQAALGVAQLEQLRPFAARKREITARYVSALHGVPGLRMLGEAPWAQSAMWLATVRIDPAAAGTDRRAVAAALGAEKIETRPLWQPMHRSLAHAASYSEPCPVADAAYGDALSLPCSTHLTEADQIRVVSALLRAVPSAAGAAPTIRSVA